MKAPVTLLDVARAASVSKSTAANVFSRPEKVRPELRDRVEQAARDLGYGGPDPRGRLLSLGRANAIGVVPPAEAGLAWVYSHPFMLQFLAGVAEVCEARNVGMLLIPARYEDGSNGIGTAVVDGMILGTVAQAKLIDPSLRRRVRCVVLDDDGGDDMSSMVFDRAGGVRLLLRHLLELGHRRFALVTTNRDVSGPILHGPGQDHRLVAGYAQEWIVLNTAREVLAEAGLSIDEMPLMEACGSDDERRDFGDFAPALLDAAPDATAIVTFNTEASLAMHALTRQRRIAVPDRLSLAGFVTREAVAHTDPAITAAVEPISPTERGRLVAEMLFDDGPVEHVVMPLELLVGGTTGPAPR